MVSGQVPLPLTIREARRESKPGPVTDQENGDLDQTLASDLDMGLLRVVFDIDLWIEQSLMEFIDPTHL